jgi:predicted component of type VI protein secretion system
MPHCEAGLSGEIAFFRCQWLVDEHVENALADLTFMEVSAFSLIEATAARSGFKQSAVFDVVYNENLHQSGIGNPRS